MPDPSGLADSDRTRSSGENYPADGGPSFSAGRADPPQPSSDAPDRGQRGSGAIADDYRLGVVVAGFTPPPAPDAAELPGRFVTLERLEGARHAADLFAANAGADQVWDYLGYGPFDDLAAYRAWQDQMAASSDPAFYAMRDRQSGQIGGLASYLRIDRANGVIEIGHIQISPAMQRSAAASESIMLMIGWAFAAGYRRVEWKCNDLNAPSMRAAARYGFRYEGTFRNHMIVKGRNRDTAWWAMTDSDWPALDRAYRRWLDPANFDAAGQQRRPLGDLIADERGQQVI